MDFNINVLSKVSLFDGIKESEISFLLGCLSVRKKFVERNGIIFNEGDFISEIGIVLSGSIKVQNVDYFGNTNIITTIQEFESFGEVLQCSGNNISLVSTIAIEDSEIMFIDFNKIINKCSLNCNFHQKIIENLIKNLANKNLLLKQKIDLLSKRDLKNKVLSFLTEQATKYKSNEFEISYDRQALADYLFVDRSALSRVLSDLKKEGKIEYNKNRFKIINL